MIGIELDMCMSEMELVMLAVYVSHVNSPDHKKMANATQSTVLTFIPSSSLMTSLRIQRRTDVVRGSRILFSLSS